MNLIIVLILGGIIGWLGARLVGRDEGIVVSVLIGIVGAIIGNTLAQLLGSDTQAYLSFTWSGFFWSLIGAIIFSAILNALQHNSTHNQV